MRKIEATDVLFSSLFFLLAVFTICVVLLSQYASSFSQIFSLVNRLGGMYSITLTILMATGLLLSLSFLLVRAPANHAHLSRRYATAIIVASLLFGILFFLGLTVHLLEHPISIEGERGLVDGFVAVRQELSRVLDSSVSRRLIEFTIYTFFVLLPLAFWIYGIEFNRSDPFGQFLHTLRPPLNCVIFALFGMAIHPLVKENWWEYVDSLFFWVGAGLLGWLFYKKKHYFGFHEMVNCVVLVIGVFIFFLGYSLFEGVEYYEAKSAFYGLVFLSWSVRWMERITR